MSRTVRGQVLGRVNGYLAAGVSPVFSGRGVSAVARNGVGDYTLTFASENQLEPTQTSFFCQPRNPLQSQAVQIAAQTDLTLQLKTFDGTGAAADRDISLFSIEMPPAAE